MVSHNFFSFSFFSPVQHYLLIQNIKYDQQSFLAVLFLGFIETLSSVFYERGNVYLVVSLLSFRQYCFDFSVLSLSGPLTWLECVLLLHRDQLIVWLTALKRFLLVACSNRTGWVGILLTVRCTKIRGKENTPCQKWKSGVCSCIDWEAALERERIKKIFNTGRCPKGRKSATQP